MPANLENSVVATGLEKVHFHSNPKEGQCQRTFKLLHNCTHLSSAQSLSCDHESQYASLPVHHQLPEFTQTHVHWVGDTIQPSHPLSSPSLPALNPSQHQGLFQWVNSSHEVKYWSFSFSISPSNEHPGLISFTMDWLNLLAVQGTLKSLLQHHSSKASILWCLAFFVVQMEDKKIKEMTRAYVTCGIPSDGSAYISWELQMEKRKSTWRYNGQNLPKFV